MAFEWNDFIKQVDEWIRTGAGAVAAIELEGIRGLKVPRKHLLRIAGLCRRVNRPLIALKLLNPVVRNSADASDAERVEYAGSLTRIGASHEALELLRDVPAAANTEALLFKSFALISEWDYEAAVPFLEEYFEAPGLSDYQRLVGRLNLGAALVYLRRAEAAEGILSELRVSARSGKHRLVLGNALELSAQNAILGERWEDAEGFLEEATGELRDAGGLDAVFARKWRAILALRQHGASPERLTALEAVRAEAVALKHWETRRECDLFEALATGSTQLLAQLHHGTPFESYRRRILAAAGGKLEISGDFVRKLGEGTEETTVDFHRGRLSRAGVILRSTSLLERLVGALGSDFYRPLGIGALHARALPNEHFNPDSSPHRVQQAILRLKQWFPKHSLPLTVRWDEGGYRLEATGPIAIHMRGDRAPIPSLLAEIRGRWPASTFTAHQASQLLGISLRTTGRLLKEAQQKGVLSRVGAGPATQYRFGNEPCRAA